MFRAVLDKLITLGNRVSRKGWINVAGWRKCDEKKQDINASFLHTYFSQKNENKWIYSSDLDKIINLYKKNLQKQKKPQFTPSSSN